MSPEMFEPETVGQDPLAEWLQADTVLRPREGYRSTLRDGLMRRPPVAPAPWQRLLPGSGATLPALMLLVTLGLLVGLGLRQRDRIVAPSDPAALATLPAAGAPQPADPEASEPEPSPARDRLRSLPPVPIDGGLLAPPAAPAPPAEAVNPAIARPIDRSLPAPTRPAAIPAPAVQDDDEAQVPPTATLPPTPTPLASPTGIVYEEPDPDPTEAPPVAPGRPIAPSPTPGIDP